MTFLSQSRLWLLLVIVVAVVVVVRSERRRARDLALFAAPDMLGWLAPRRPGWRQAGALSSLLLTLTLLVVASARPARSVEVPVKIATVIVAVDKSTSMGADDVSPSRLTAAQRAASRFIHDLPRYFRVGVVLFAGFGAAPQATLDLDVIHYREVSLVGSEWIGTPPNQRRERYADALELITSGQVPVERLVSGEVGLDGIEGAYAAVREQRGLKYVLRPWQRT